MQFEMIPSHTKIQSNDRADELARAGCDLENMYTVKMDSLELLNVSKRDILLEWNRAWKEGEPEKAKWSN